MMSGVVGKRPPQHRAAQGHWMRLGMGVKGQVGRAGNEGQVREGRLGVFSDPMRSDPLFIPSRDKASPRPECRVLRCLSEIWNKILRLRSIHLPIFKSIALDRALRTLVWS